MNTPILRGLSILLSVSAVLLWLPSAGAEDLPGAEDLVARSIGYHDPDSRLLSSAHHLTLRSERPDGPTRLTDLVIDASSGRFEITEEKDGGTLHGVLKGETCEKLADIEGAERPLTCERLRWIRNYYVYLWALPMKLRDPGTQLGAVERTSFQGQDVWSLRVTYDPAVGSDVWYFYFDPGTAALVGYRFYHDEAAGDGEYIVLDGEEATADGRVRLPKKRTWFTHQGDKLLGSDILESMSGIGEP